MSYIAINMNVSFLIREKSVLEFEEMSAISDVDGVLEQMTSYLKVSGNKATDNDYIQLQNKQQAYDSAKNSIESRLKVINAQIEGYQKAVDANIKTECKLSISA